MWTSSNPVLNHSGDTFDQHYGKKMFVEQSSVTTMAGVINKTTILVAITVICGAVGYSLSVNHPQIYWISAIVSLITGLGIAFTMAGKPTLAPIVAPIYAVTEGVFLGAFTAFADAMLASRGLALAGGIGVQAFIVTASVMVSMLILYRMRLVRPTERFQAVLRVAMLGISLAYLASFVMMLFGQSMPLISAFAAMNDRGPMALVGLGVNGFILVIAALSLVVDFGRIEESVESGAPKYMEWYCGFALLVTLAWIYYESVKMLLRVASLLGSRK